MVDPLFQKCLRFALRLPPRCRLHCRRTASASANSFLEVRKASKGSSAAIFLNLITARRRCSESRQHTETKLQKPCKNPIRDTTLWPGVSFTLVVTGLHTLHFSKPERRSRTDRHPTCISADRNLCLIRLFWKVGQSPVDNDSFSSCPAMLSTSRHPHKQSCDLCTTMKRLVGYPALPSVVSSHVDATA